MLIPFNKPCYLGNEYKFIDDAIKSGQISGNGKYTKLCEKWFENRYKVNRALLTPSCTSALEFISILLDLQLGDEVIMPSYTFVSTANAFVLRGAKIKFVDIEPDTMNIDVNKIQMAITEKTKVIVVVHYGGISCDMDRIVDIAKNNGIYLIEDAAQAIESKYKDRYLGTFGDLSAVSFHETKNITSAGEGGVLLINNSKFIERAEIIREKGTNRNKFFRGEVDKYSWVDIGSSFLMNDISAAYLYGQLKEIDSIVNNRLEIWNYYYNKLRNFEDSGIVELANIPNYCKSNGHLFYMKLKDKKNRDFLLDFLNNNGVNAVFHYIPLHSSIAGKKYGEFIGDDIVTTKDSERLLRFPIFYGLKKEEIEYIVKKVKEGIMLL